MKHHVRIIAVAVSVVVAVATMLLVYWLGSRYPVSIGHNR